MHSHVVLASVLILATGCSSTDEKPERTLPSAGPSSVTPTESVTPSRTPEPTCGPLSGNVSKSGSEFIVEFNIMSGNPNPAWRLSKAEGRRFERLLRTTHRGIQTEAPDELGGLEVIGGRRAAVTLHDLNLPERFWVQGNNPIAEFLGQTVPCNA